MSLVSKRFHALCLAPQLNREVFVQPRHAPDASLRSLNLWMARHGQHLTN